MTRRPEHSAFARRSMFGAIALAALLLAGCGSPAPAPTRTTTSSPTDSSPSPSASQTPTGPMLDLEGTAEDNLPYFTGIVDAVWATPAQVQGRAYIDALVAGGFDRDAMQVTQDLSTVGNPAESIQFSVRWGSECLIGQVGPATGAPFTTTAPLLEGDLCLIGKTRPIDW